MSLQMIFHVTSSNVMRGTEGAFRRVFPVRRCCKVTRFITNTNDFPIENLKVVSHVMHLSKSGRTKSARQRFTLGVFLHVAFRRVFLVCRGCDTANANDFSVENVEVVLHVTHALKSGRTKSAFQSPLFSVFPHVIFQVGNAGKV